MIRLTLLYASLILGVVLVADAGWLPKSIQQVHDLPHVDKVIHFSIFGTLALCINFTLACNRRWSVTRAIATGSILVVMASTIDEGTNLFVAYRTWSLGDLAANYLGVICLGIVPMLGWRRPEAELADRGRREVAKGELCGRFLTTPVDALANLQEAGAPTSS